MLISTSKVNANTVMGREPTLIKTNPSSCTWRCRFDSCPDYIIIKIDKMLNSIIKFLLFTIFFVGMVYLMGVFISSEWNIFIWPWWGKLIFLLLFISIIGNVVDNIDEL